MNWLGKFFLLFLGIIIAFGAGEIYLRAKRAAVASHVMHYDGKTGLIILKPNSRFFDKNSCWENTIKANSEGFHDSEFSLQKPDDVYRIAIIGDSMVESYQVPIEKSFHYLLEPKLKELAKDKKIEIYSFGVGGTGTFSHYLYLNQYVLKYNPDLVILAFLSINDFGDDIEQLDEIFDKQGFVREEVPLEKKILGHSVFYRWLNAKWGIYKSYAFDKTEAEVPFDFQVFLKDYPPDWLKIWNLEKKLILQFKDKVEESGGKFLLVSLPDLWRTHPHLIENDQILKKGLSGADLDFAKPEKIFQAFSQEENFSFFDLTAPFQERAKNYDKEVFFCSCDGHWNETGHLWAEEEFFNFFNSQNGQKLLIN